VAPLMARALLLHRMAPDAWLEGTVIVVSPLGNGEIA
jgi:hypothetical protein